MVRLASEADPFAAVADPTRRRIIDLLALGERPVNDVVAELGVAQPQVSKHLRVLKEAGLVQARRAGRQRLYRVDGDGLRTLRDWIATFDRFWSHQLNRIKASAERGARPTGDRR